MPSETIKAGEWIIKENTPHKNFYIYKLLKGTVSVHKGSKIIREMEIKEGMSPIMIGLGSLFAESHEHTASIKAETDIEVEVIHWERLKDVVENEIPNDIKSEIAVMRRAIVTGSDMIRSNNIYSRLAKIDLKIPENASPETIEIITEVKRLYTLITGDVEDLYK